MVVRHNNKNMKTILTIIAALAVIVTASAQTSEETKKVEVIIKNVSSEKGSMKIAVYDSEDKWLKKPKYAKSAVIVNNQAKVVFEIKKTGTYAVSCYHDENGNDKLDTNLFGIPKETIGASNNARGQYGPPKWSEAKFELNKNVKQIITL